MYLATFARRRDFFKAGKTGEGTWKLNACPMDGGGLVVSRESRRNRLAARARDFPGEPGRDRKTGSAKGWTSRSRRRRRAYLAFVDGTKVEAWIDGKQEQLAENGAFPSVLGLPGGGALAAWEENGAIQIQRLP